MPHTNTCVLVTDSAISIESAVRRFSACRVWELTSSMRARTTDSLVSIAVPVGTNSGSRQRVQYLAETWLSGNDHRILAHDLEELQIW
jgi:hypothetical protein